MSVTDMVGRVSQIQQTLVQLANPSQIAATQKASAATTTSPAAASFAEALTAATGSPAASTAIPGTAAKPLSSAGATGADVAATARKYLGVPYVWGGTNPATGLDCSGLVQRVFKDLGVDVPRVVNQQQNVGTPVASLAEAKPGDLLIMNGAEHIGIYMGNNQYLHAPQPGDVVRIDSIPAGAKFDKIVRVVPAEAAAPTVSANDAATSMITAARAALLGGAAA